MKLVIAGGRDIQVPIDFIEQARQLFGLRPSEIVSGGASGVDRAAEIFSDKYNYPIKIFRAEWERYGRFAGPRRNKEMAEYGDALLLIWNGISKGSLSMRTEMMNQLMTKPRNVITIKKEDLRFKPRLILKASKRHKDKTKYDRKEKHRRKHVPEGTKDS
jgi:hypothetical protein